MHLGPVKEQWPTPFLFHLQPWCSCLWDCPFSQVSRNGLTHQVDERTSKEYVGALVGSVALLWTEPFPLNQPLLWRFSLYRQLFFFFFFFCGLGYENREGFLKVPVKLQFLPFQSAVPSLQAKTTAFSLPLLLCCEIAVKLYPRVSCIVAGEEMVFFCPCTKVNR